MSNLHSLLHLISLVVLQLVQIRQTIRARAGVTFRYTENGPVGLLKNKKVIVVAARGGVYSGTEHDSQTQYLKDFLAFIGIEDVTFVYAEGLNMPGNETRLLTAQNELTRITL